MKPTCPPPQAQPQGWHPADVVAALRKRGWSFRRLSVHHGYSPQVLSRVNRVPWPKGERLVAEAIGVPPQELWPERYGADGLPNRRIGRRPNDGFKNTAIPTKRNGKPDGAN